MYLDCLKKNESIATAAPYGCFNLEISNTSHSRNCLRARTRENEKNEAQCSSVKRHADALFARANGPVASKTAASVLR